MQQTLNQQRNINNLLEFPLELSLPHMQIKNCRKDSSVMPIILLKGNSFKKTNYIIMPVRRIWTQFQDTTLRYLKEDLNIQKWSLIAEKMENEFGIVGRNQKQCRQRYHNHLDSRLKSGKLTENQQKLLFKLHNRLGNKWAEIASYFLGRTDSSLKNIFHSNLRKGIRKFNRTAKEIFNQKAKTYPLNILCTIMDNCSFKFESQTCKNVPDSDFLKQIQNQLIQYGGTPVSEPQQQGMNKKRKFQHLFVMLSKVQLSQKTSIPQISESSEYIPAHKKEIQSLISYKKAKSNENDSFASIYRDNSSEMVPNSNKISFIGNSEAQQQVSLIEKNSFQTEPALSEDIDAKSQNEHQDLIINQQVENHELEYNELKLENSFDDNWMLNFQKSDETEIYYREIPDPQCSRQQELFTLMLDSDSHQQPLF